jgi:hypothetical protein
LDTDDATDDKPSDPTGDRLADLFDVGRDPVADARACLLEALTWQLERQRWERVDQIVESMTAALAAGDMGAFRGALVGLEVAGPPRAIPIGSIPLSLLPAPRRVRERVNRLIHSLDPAASAAASPDDHRPEWTNDRPETDDCRLPDAGKDPHP